MEKEEAKSRSKFLSLVLRHRPSLIGIELDSSGWIDVDVLLEAMRRAGKPLSLEQLRFVVENNDKSRFSFDASGAKIRANQGHSVSVDLELEPQAPPAVLYHGTYDAVVPAILKEGLLELIEEICADTA